MSREERRRAIALADRQIAEARLELLALKAQGTDLSGAQATLTAFGMDLQKLLAADTKAKRLALAGPVKAALALPPDPLAAQAKFFEAYMRSLAGELLAIANSPTTQPAAGEPGPYADN